MSVENSNYGLDRGRIMARKLKENYVRDDTPGGKITQKPVVEPENDKDVENGKGGKYNAPQFVLTGQNTVKPCEDEDMLRYGYTFGGWYKDAELKQKVNDTSITLERDTTLYAKWEASKASNTISSYWR